VAVLPQAAVLARHGFTALLLDARGHGRSEGRAMDFGWRGDQDLDGAVDYLAELPEVAPGRIGLLGLSMGGEESLGALGADPRVRAVAAEGVTARTAGDKAAWLPGGLDGWLQRRIDTATYAAAGLLSGVPQPVDLRTALDTPPGRPVLLIAAGTDPDEQAAAGRLRAGNESRVQEWVVAGSRHTGGLATRPQEWESRVVGFLDAALAPRF
jgi:pimeloyl-ACP methyl ester carboxylesterase